MTRPQARTSFVFPKHNLRIYFLLLYRLSRYPSFSFLLFSLRSFFPFFFLLHIIERHGKAKKKSVFVSTNPVIIIIFGKTCSDSTAECKMLVFVQARTQNLFRLSIILQICHLFVFRLIHYCSQAQPDIDAFYYFAITFTRMC